MCVPRYFADVYRTHSKIWEERYFANFATLAEGEFEISWFIHSLRLLTALSCNSLSLAAKIHFIGHFNQLAAHCLAQGIAIDRTQMINTVGHLFKLNILRVGTNVITETQKGLVPLYFVLYQHPGTINALVHISMNVAQELGTRHKQIFLVQIQMQVHAQLLTEKVAFKRTLSSYY